MPFDPSDLSALSEPARQETASGPAGRPVAGFAPQVGNRCSVLAVCGLLLLAVITVFGQTARYGFVNFDDDLYVYENRHVQAGLTGAGIAWAFSRSHASNWHPLTWLSLMADAQELRPVEGPLQLARLAAKMHTINVVLHAMNAVILFLVLMEMTASVWPSAFVAALFAVHPLHVESVAWISERKDVLSGLFFMLTLAAYLGYARRPFSLFRYLLVTALLALGLMAKPMLVTLPCVFLLLDYWPLRRAGSGERGAGSGEQVVKEGWHAFTSTMGTWCPTAGRHVGGRAPCTHDRGAEGRDNAWARRRPWRLIVEKLPWLALAALSCVVTYWAQQQVAVVPFQRLPLGPRVANALVSCVAYLGQLFFPTGLAVLYPHPQDALPLWKIVGAGLLLAGISLAVLACRRKCPYLLVGWLWFLGTLVPVSGLVQVGAQAMADRYSYLAHIGLYIALAWTAMHVSRSWRHSGWACGLSAAAALAALMGCAWQQTGYWRDSETLWRHTLDCTSRNAAAHDGLGLVLASYGRVDEAIAQYRKALEIEPGYAVAHTNLGLALARRGQVDAAIAQYQEAVRLKPGLADARNNLGAALAGRGELNAAIAQYGKALEINPDYPEAHNNLAAALAARGQIDAAITHYRKALEIKPGYASAHYNLGVVLAGHGRPAEALDHFQKALALATAKNDVALAELIRAQIRRYKPPRPGGNRH